jgi:transposase
VPEHRGATCPKSLASGTACSDVENLLAYKDYDSDRFRASVADAGAQAVIPSNRSRAIPYDKDLYNLVEWFTNKIKR